MGKGRGTAKYERGGVHVVCVCVCVCVCVYVCVFVLATETNNFLKFSGLNHLRGFFLLYTHKTLNVT